jgi:uncharacterized protein (TIGR03083 family)
MVQANPIITIDLFPIIDHILLDLLRSLSPEDWEKPTLAPLWKVKDVASHLLDGNIRGVSISRDLYFGEKSPDDASYPSLVNYLNRLNADWVKATRRISPQVLISLLEMSGKAYYEHLKELDPFTPSIFPVAWAGETHSENWFHIAREYTEKWHHQQQIRLAVGNTGALLRKELYHPFLETSMRALPHHYKDVEAQSNDVIRVTVTGDGGGEWFLMHEKTGWILLSQCSITPISQICIDEDIAWRLFTKGIDREQAAQKCRFTGNQDLGRKILSMLEVMA